MSVGRSDHILTYDPNPAGSAPITRCSCGWVSKPGDAIHLIALQHEHQMVPDHPVPPFVWHYKCSVESCDYETDSLKIPDDKDTEIARLRAEVESKTKAADWFRQRAEETVRERDEALAQVAVLFQEMQRLHRLSCSQPQGLYCEQPKTHALLDTLSVEVRALLDRLQRAEALVEALREYANPSYWGWLMSYEGQQSDPSKKAREALAAWEKGKE